jgi:hypothetical protein
MATKKAPAAKTAKAVATDGSTVPTKKIAAKKKAIATTEQVQIAASHHDIEALAYHLWVQRGREHGGDAQDWLTAEQQLLK